MNDQQPQTLVDVLQHWTETRATATAFTFLIDGEDQTETMTYAELDLQARTIAAVLQTRTRLGDRVLLIYPAGLALIAALMGCFYAGVVAVPAYPPRPNQTLHRLQTIAINANATVVLTNQATIDSLATKARLPRLSELHWIATDSLAADADRFQTVAVTEDTIALLQFTSGSTGTPKGVVVTHGNLMYNEQVLQQALSHDAQTRYVSWLPMHHDMGLMGNILQPLYLGVPCLLMPPAAFLMRPFRWLQAISRYRATTSGAPNFAYDLCVQKISEAQKAELDLSCWTIAYNGAEPIRASTLERFAAAFQTCGFDRNAFYPCYGMAETTLFLTGNGKGQGATVLNVDEAALQQDQVVLTAAARSIVSCGKTWAADQIAIVNPQTLQPCAPDQVGEIWVQSPSVAQGYWNQPHETAQTFRASISGLSGQFLRTGDLGFLHHGELYVTGRLKDVLIIRGKNHYPQDIELTAEQSHSALRAAGGAAFTIETADSSLPEKLVLVHEVERSQIRRLQPDSVIAAIRQAIAQEHGLQVHDVVLIKPGALPKTSSGKVQRRLCRSLYSSQQFEPITAVQPAAVSLA